MNFYNKLQQDGVRDLGLIIRNGTIVDGTGARPYRGDIRIRDGQIAEIASSLATTKGEEEFRAEGLYVTPGFIDAHSHNDLAAFSEEGYHPKVLQEYVFQRRLLPIEEMIHKMTGKAARILSLEQRGTLEPGAAADVAVFGEDFSDRENRREPEKPAEGLRLLTVNGEAKVLDSSLRPGGSAASPGRVLTV